jgi:hypothetical protein
VIIGDIDSAVVGDLRSVKRYVAESDIGVNAATSPDSFRKFPWNSVSGGYMFFKNSKLGVNLKDPLASQKPLLVFSIDISSIDLPNQHSITIPF